MCGVYTERIRIMDTTNEYRNMCRKADEIQDSWECQLGDFYGHFGSIKIWGVDDEADNHSNKAIVSIWLPRQDQLQEMYAKNVLDDLHFLFDPFALLDIIHCYVKDDCDNHKHEDVSYEECSSMEQLWLFFVMKTVHNKYWDGDNWLRKKPEGK